MSAGFLGPIIIGILISILLLFLIHFFGVRIRRAIDFSQNQFLSSVITKSKAVQNFRNKELFLIRVLAILFFGFAVYYFIKNNGFLKGGDNKKIVIVDDSWSMMANYSGSRDSKLLYSGLVAQSNPNFQNNHSFRTTSGNVIDKDSLSKVSPKFNQGKLSTSQFVASNRYEYLLLSDLQKSTLSKVALQALANQAPVKIVNLSGDNNHNIYIDSVWLSNPVGIKSRNLELVARLSISGPKNSSLVKVSLISGNVLMSRTEVTVNSSNKETIKFNVSSTSLKNDVKVRLVINDSSNAFDNEYFVVLPKSEQFEVVVDPSFKASRSVLRALNQESGFKVVNRISEQTDNWIFQPTGKISSATSQSIKGWLKAGKSLVIIPPSNSISPLVDLLNTLGVKDVKARPVEDLSLKLISPDFSDPFFQGVFERKNIKITMPSIDPLLLWQSSFHSILTFEDKSPFLSSFKVGEGNIHLFASSLEGSEFVSHPLFLPIIYQLLVRSDGTTPLAFSGDAERILLPIEFKRKGEELIALHKDDKVFVPQQSWDINQVAIQLPEDLQTPGFYDVFLGDRLVSTIAINIPSSESDLESYSNVELEDVLSKSKYPVEIIDIDFDQSIEKTLEKETRDTDLTKYCLILCLLLLLVEVFILRKRASGTPT